MIVRLSVRPYTILASVLPYFLPIHVLIKCLSFTRLCIKNTYFSVTQLLTYQTVNVLVNQRLNKYTQLYLVIYVWLKKKVIKLLIII